jgi:pimeloyl-ACP methyl ester carboxylesterase
MAEIGEGIAIPLLSLFRRKEKEDESLPLKIVPIIFVPGIMGSTLRQTPSRQNSEGSRVWWPGNPYLWMAPKYIRADAETRRERLVGLSHEWHRPDYLTVDGDTSPGSRDRGRSTVAKTSYGQVLKRLSATRWREKLGNPAYRLRVPVHAFGYNWTASNAIAGEKLAKLIDEIIAHYQPQCDECPGVIIVTHSMGGLVGRHACKVAGAEGKVLGVIHGVQPVVGSPAAYWRMKGGWDHAEGVGHAATASVLGKTSREVTAVLANIPGGLELLPTMDYTDNEGNAQWLNFDEELLDGQNPLPKGSDPYESIYKERYRYWRMVTDAYLNPAKTTHADIDEEWSEYISRVGDAKAFHQTLKLQQHAKTYCFYGTGTKHLAV